MLVYFGGNIELLVPENFLTVTLIENFLTVTLIEL